MQWLQRRRPLLLCRVLISVPEPLRAVVVDKRPGTAAIIGNELPKRARVIKDAGIRVN